MVFCGNLCTDQDIRELHAGVVQVCSVSHRRMSRDFPRQLWLALIEAEKPKNYFEARLPFLIEAAALTSSSASEHPFLRLFPEDLASAKTPSHQSKAIALYSATLTLSLLTLDGATKTTQRLWEPPHDFDTLIRTAAPACRAELVLSQVRFANELTPGAALPPPSSNYEEDNSSSSSAARLIDAWTQAKNFFNDATRN